MEYYRPQELESKFSLTIEALRRLIEQDKVSVAVFSTSTKFIYGFQKSRFHGSGICSYEGLVGLYRHDALQLLQSGKARISRGALLEPEKAKILSTDYPFQTKLPNTFVHTWNAASFKGAKVKSVDVKKYPFESKGIASVFNDAIKGSKLLDLEIDERSASTLSRFDNYQLTSDSDIYVLPDICVTADELYRAGVIDEPPTPESMTKEDYKVGKRSNELHELLFKILQHTDEKLSAKQCEKILASEAKLADSEREFDTAAILRDVSESELAWVSSRGNYQTFQLSSLGTTLSKLKKRFK
jgi:hypothetical protein